MEQMNSTASPTQHPTQATLLDSNTTPLLRPHKHMPLARSSSPSTLSSPKQFVQSSMVIASKKLTKPKAFFRIALLLIVVLWEGELVVDLACGEEELAPIIALEPQSRMLRRLRGADHTDTTIATTTETTELIAPTFQSNHTTFESLSQDLSLVRLFSKKKEVQFNSENKYAPKLCYFGSLKDLDELMHVFTRLLLLGQQLGRTVVVPPYFSSLYDPYLMNTNDTVQVSKNQAFCDPRNTRPNVTYWDEPTTLPTDHKIHKSNSSLTSNNSTSIWPAVFEDRDDAILYIGGEDLKAHEHGLFSFPTSAAKEEDYERLLFANLYPYRETRELVHEFIEINFDSQPFVAVHLDVCERTTTTTTPTDNTTANASCAETGPSLLRWVLQQHAPSLIDAPVFVSVTPEFAQQNTDLLSLVHNVTGAVMFESQCPRLYECDMVNREIAAHSTFFYSARNSATTKHIESLRRWRHNALGKQQLPGLVQSFSIETATQGGWKPDVVVADVVVEAPAAVTAAVSPLNPSPPVLSHYEAYLSALKMQRPEMASSVEDGPLDADDSLLHAQHYQPQHTRGVVPINGIICQFGTFEQLNNILDQTAGLLHVGRQLGRTVVIPALVSALYDVNFLERDQPFSSIRAADGSWFRPSRISTDESLCDPAHGWKFSDVSYKRGPTAFVSAYMHLKAPVLMVSAKSSFHYGFNDRSMFTYLHPRKETREIAVNFVQDNFGDKPFVAVHLRFLDGKCYIVSHGDVACDLDPNLLRWVLARNAPELLDAPVFVASDHQRIDLEHLFTKVGAVFYRGDCHSYDKQCMVIDAEIAARSAYFYGLHMSTAAQTIERFRRQRHNGTPFKQLEAFPTIYGGYFGPSPDQWRPVRWESRSPEKYFASRPKEAMEQIAGTLPPNESVIRLKPVAKEFVKLQKCRTSFRIWFRLICMLAIFYPLLVVVVNKVLSGCGCVEMLANNGGMSGGGGGDPLDAFLAAIVVAAKEHTDIDDGGRSSGSSSRGRRTGSHGSENSNNSTASSKCD